MHKKNTVEETVSYVNTQKTNRSNIIALVICALASVCIWFYVMSVDSPIYEETFSSVPVELKMGSGESSNSDYSAISGTGNVIEVTLKGRKTILNALKAEEIEACVDVSNVSAAGRASYGVVLEPPSGTVIVDYYPKEISVYMDRRTSKQIPVRVELEGSSYPENYILDIQPSVDTVTVTGPETELELIEAARVVISPGPITGSSVNSGKVALVDGIGKEVKSNYLTTDVTNVTVKIVVYLEKDIPLSVAYVHGYYNDDTVSVKINPEVIPVRGTKEQLDQMTEILVATIDETQIHGDGVYYYNLTLPEGIEVLEAYERVAVTINHASDYAQRTIEVTDIRAENVPSGKTVDILAEAIQVQLRGEVNKLYEITAEDVYLVVDMQNMTQVTGNVYATATALVKEGNSSELYPIGSYVVPVSISG